MHVEASFDRRTWTLTYLVWDSRSRDAVVIDAVLDYDAARVRIYDESVSRLLTRIEQLGLRVHLVLETHAHADHLTAADLLRKRLGAKIAIGRRITEVQRAFAGVFGLSADFHTDGRQFDHLVAEGDELQAGSLRIGVIETPGHTPACVSWRIGDAVFTGDALFMPDQGTGRCDFPNGSAEALWDSIRKLYALPRETRVFVGHDYQPNGRGVRFESTIGAEIDGNVQLRGDTPREAFVEWRRARDRTLALPTLLFPSLQVNIRAGQLPPMEAGGRFMRLPINRFDEPVPE